VLLELSLIDNPNSFWVWTHLTTAANATSVFQNIKVSDGSILTTRNHATYEIGAWQGLETATPTSRFGNSYSCPFMILRTAPPGLYVIVPNRRTDTNGTADVAIPTPTFKTALMP